jgi:hypothetical protein
VRGVPRNQRPLAPLPILFQVLLLEGWLPSGNNRLIRSPNEAGPVRRLHLGVPDQLE